MLEPSGLSDDDLKAALLRHGVKAGPIVGEVVFECSPAVCPCSKDIAIVVFVCVRLHQGPV